MIKRLFYLLAAGGLAAGLMGAGLAAGPALDRVDDRYPGAVRIADDVLDLRQLGQGVLQWQASYQTPDALLVVRQWYAARWQISPASEQYLTGGDGCAWLTQSDLIVRLERTGAVLLCPLLGGTRVVVNERVALAR